MADIADPPVTLLVNSSDGFEDCWPIFFHFFDRYWPQFRGPILLNTETKAWPRRDPRLACSRVALGETRRLTWSECLIRALDQLNTPLVLYVQEDYFIDRPVRDVAVREAIDLMLSAPHISHIALTKHASHGPYDPSPFPGFQTIRQNARYRIATQAALWRVPALRSYLHPRENGWMFEILGTRRARRRQDTFLVADFSPERDGPALDYIHTGIIKGRWHPGMPKLFSDHGLVVDTSRRGIYIEPDPVRRKMEVIRKLATDPGHLLRQLFLPGAREWTK